MKNFTQIIKVIDKIITLWLESYILKVSKTLYPKTYLDEEDEDDDDPILFI